MNQDQRSEQVRQSSYADFYRTQYGQVITSLRPAGRVGATLLEAEQPAGDWSDAATSDLIIAQHLSQPAQVSMDLGAGRFHGIGRTNDFIAGAPGVESTILVDSAHRIRVLAIPWEAMRAWADSDELRLSSDGDFGVLHQGFNRSSRLTLLLDTLWRQNDGMAAAEQMFTDGLLLQIVATLIDIAHPQRMQPTQGLTRHALLKVDACMRARLAEDIGLADLAELTGLSVAHFCRAFKRSTGRTPYQSLIELRMQDAQRLLSETNLSIAEVALSCGYDQPSHFAKLFRRSTGLPPAQWRRQCSS
jgi:AraC family transcriptional regulator